MCGTLVVSCAAENLETCRLYCTLIYKNIVIAYFADLYPISTIVKPLARELDFANAARKWRFAINVGMQVWKCLREMHPLYCLHNPTVCMRVRACVRCRTNHNVRYVCVCVCVHTNHDVPSVYVLTVYVPSGVLALIITFHNVRTCSVYYTFIMRMIVRLLLVSNYVYL